MSSQEDCSEIEQENIQPIFLKNTNKNTNQYITFHQIQRYQAEKFIYNQSQHINCIPQSIRWIKDNQNDPTTTFIIRNPPQQYLIDHCISLCCFHLRLLISFALKKDVKLQIIKIKKNGASLMQQGTKYSLQHGIGAIKIQISITKQKQNKIWKQMQIPIRSHQPSATYILILQQSPKGQILLNLNDFEFVINLALSHTPQTYFIIKTQNIIHRIQFQQTKIKDLQGSGCNKNYCVIF